MLSSVIVSARNALYGDKIKFLTKSEIELMIAKTNRADIQPYELLKFLNTYVTQAKAKSKYETFLSKTIEDVLSCISRNLDEITKNYPDERNDIAMLLTKLKSLCPASLFQPQSSGASINRLGTVGSTNREDNQYFPPSKVHKANLNTGFSSACTYNRPLLLLSSLLPIKESVEDKLTIPNSSENPIVAKIPENTDLTAKTNSDGRIITNHILLTREMGAKTSFRSAHLDEIKITGKVEEKTFTNNSSLVLHHIYYELDLAYI